MKVLRLAVIMNDTELPEGALAKSSQRPDKRHWVAKMKGFLYFKTELSFGSRRCCFARLEDEDRKGPDRRQDHEFGCSR